MRGRARGGRGWGGDFKFCFFSVNKFNFIFVNKFYMNSALKF